MQYNAGILCIQICKHASMQVCTYADASMQVYMYAVCKCAVCKYTSMQYASMQYASSMPVCKNASMQVCRCKYKAV